jgi:hypothetical protein
MNNEGYWGYSHMMTQLDNCVECVKVMYPQFDFIFLFNHSSGDSKKQIGGLDASSMNKESEGAQPIMRTSKMEAEDGLLGPFDRILSVGEVQSMQFLTDPGPFWVTKIEEEDCKKQDKARQDSSNKARKNQKRTS